MSTGLSRRTALGLGTAAAATAVLAVGTPAFAVPGEPESPVFAIRAVYRRQAARAGGSWNSYISLSRQDVVGTVVAKNPDAVVEAYSVNKIAVAVALLDKVDRGLIGIDQRVDVTADIIVAGGDGIFGLDGAYPSSVTLGHVLAALLTISDDTAVRLGGLYTTSYEINEILVAKGFPNTQVQPVANPHRYFLGRTTPREMHDLLWALATGQLLSVASTIRILTLLRSPIAFTDGVRRTMSSDQRGRIATKAGWFADGRNEVGIIFSEAGVPMLTYSMFASGQANPGDFGATHPAVAARAAMGPVFLKAADRAAADAVPAPGSPAAGSTPAGSPRGSRSAARPLVVPSKPYRPSLGG